MRVESCHSSTIERSFATQPKQSAGVFLVVLVRKYVTKKLWKTTVHSSMHLSSPGHCPNPSSQYMLNGSFLIKDLLHHEIIVSVLECGSLEYIVQTLHSLRVPVWRIYYHSWRTCLIEIYEFDLDVVVIS
jgi:hypothetical protein